ncbi:MAG TPA: ABC transporter permease subunit [Panacibacter sp.]|nr:ABC transporter permease subunit [Panacibacter sp.]HNP43002.1 ABC transporter permease subunit [Panacibacter sp.]
MWKLLQIELYKIYRRPRTYISFAAITALICVIQLGLKVDGEAYLDFLMNSLKDNFDFDGKILNGYLVCYVILQLLLIHVPLLISLIAADMISGEANMGTLRLLLTKPVSKTNFILAKFFASAIYTLTLLTWIAVFALAGSIWLFGADDLIIQKTSYVVQIASNDVLWRYIGAFFFAYLSMLTVAAIGFFFSIFAENSIGPIITTMSIIIVFTILSTMSIPIFQKIQPYLFTTHMVNWKEFFDEQVNDQNVVVSGSIQNMPGLLSSALVLVLHIVGLVTASVIVFRKKDVLS